MTLSIAYDYNQLYLYDGDRKWPSGTNPLLDALDAATESGLTVGARSDVVDVLMPRQDNFDAVVEVRLTTDSPPMSEDADHVVEFDLPLPSGRLILEGSGGCEPQEATVGAGTYRARLTGWNFDTAAAWNYDDTGNPNDRYKLDIWPSVEARPPVELRRWPGYAKRL
jgi:hypothetical protein